MSMPDARVDGGLNHLSMHGVHNMSHVTREADDDLQMSYPQFFTHELDHYLLILVPDINNSIIHCLAIIMADDDL